MHIKEETTGICLKKSIFWEIMEKWLNENEELMYFGKKIINFVLDFYEEISI